MAQLAISATAISIIVSIRCSSIALIVRLLGSKKSSFACG
jgi:hypothetical protein